MIPTVATTVVHLAIGDCSDMPAVKLPPESAEQAEIVAELHCDEPGLFDLAAIEPDVVLVDLRGSDPDSVGTRLRLLRERFPKLKLLTIGQPGDEAAARASVLQNVAAHLSRDISPVTLLRAIVAVQRGQLNLGATAQRAIQKLARGE